MEPLYIPIADLFPFYAFWRAAPKGRDGRERIKDTEMNISENNAGLILFHFQIPKTMLMSLCLEVTSIQMITSKRNVGSYMISD